MLDKTEISFFDVVNTNESHREFNEGVYQKHQISNLNVKFYLHKNSNTLRNNNCRVDLKFLPFNLSSMMYRWVFVNIVILVICIKNYNKKIVFLHLAPLSQFVVCLCAIFMTFPPKFYMHGELSYLVKTTGLGQRIGSRVLRFLLREHFSGVQKIVLSRQILRTLQSETTVNFELCKYEAQKITRDIVFQDYDIVRGSSILITGIISRHKNALLANELIKNTSFRQKHTLTVIGKFDGSLSEDDFDDNIQVVNTRTFIPQERYIRMLKEANAVFIPQLFSKSYSFVYSGMLETCLRTGTPIITRRTNYLSELEAKFGKIGILIDEPEELVTRKFDETTAKDWDMFSKNILKALSEIE